MMRFLRSLLIASALSVVGASGALAQPWVCDPANNGNCVKPLADGSINVNGNFSATLSGFNPTAGATANVSDIVNVSQDVALPAGADIVVTNKGSVDVNFRIQAGAGTAVSTDQTLKAGAAAGFHVLTATHLSVIAPTGSGTGATAGQLNIQGGTGLASGYGGGSSTLPTGAATSALQTTGNTSAATTATNTGTTATGIGAPGDSVCGSATGSCSIEALIKFLNNAAIASIPSGTNPIGTTQPGTTPACGSVIAISQTASTDLHTASGKTYICSIVLVSPDAEVVSLVEGTGSTCATGVAALLGATTAANGMSFAANGGFTSTSASPWLAMQTASDHVCLLQSGSGRISGVITYNDH